MDIGVTSSTLLVCVYLLSINEEHTSPVQVLKRIDHVLNEHLSTSSSEGEGEDKKVFFSLKIGSVVVQDK